MAKGESGLLVSNVRGSVGDVTYRVVRGQQIIQSKPIPPVHETLPAVATKNSVRAAASAWSRADILWRRAWPVGLDRGLATSYSRWVGAVAAWLYDSVWPGLPPLGLPVSAWALRSIGVGVRHRVYWDDPPPGASHALFVALAGTRDDPMAEWVAVPLVDEYFEFAGNIWAVVAWPASGMDGVFVWKLGSSDALNFVG